jgi:hypothetical protein
LLRDYCTATLPTVEGVLLVEPVFTHDMVIVVIFAPVIVPAPFDTVQVWPLGWPETVTR